jgi:hypothetical protein
MLATISKEAEMERLEAKRIKGHTYYYYSKWARVDNRCRRVWQKYLGKLEDIVAAVQGVDRRRSPPRSSNGDCPRPSGRKPAAPNSSSSSTAIAGNDAKA